MQKLPFDPIKDFALISEFASLPLILVVHPSLPATNLKEFIAMAKSKAGGWDYASSGVGTSPHLAAEMFKSMAGVDLVHVPYKGNAEAMNAFLGGHIKIYFALVPAVLQHIKAGSLRPIAVTTEQRLPYLPDVPTIAESGFPGYEISSWQGVFAPGGTPRDVVGKINGEVVRLLSVPEVRARISLEGADPVGSSPDAFAERVKSEIAKWTKVARSAGIAGPTDAPSRAELGGEVFQVLAAMSTGAFGAASPVPGPFSSGRAMWPVRRPHLAAARRSLVWAATIMHSPGGRSSASQAAR